MGNTDSQSNLVSKGAELHAGHTWWGRGHTNSGRSYRNPNPPIRSQGSHRIQRQPNPTVVLNDGFGTEFANTTVTGAWPVANSDNRTDGSNTILMGAWPVVHSDNVNDDSAFRSIKSGSLISDGSCHDTATKFENNLSRSLCQDSGFGESFMVPSRASSPDLRPKQEAGKKDQFKTRIRKLSDWTGSLNRKKRRVQVRLDQ